MNNKVLIDDRRVFACTSPWYLLRALFSLEDYIFALVVFLFRLQFIGGREISVVFIFIFLQWSLYC